MWEGGYVKRVQEGSIHVYFRGNNRQNVFYEDADRISFLSRCGFYSNKYDSVVQEFVLMDNHVHLQLQTNQLTRLMKSILVSFGHYYNKKHNTSGNLFQSPFNSVCKYSDEWKIDSMLYILQNPLAAEICKHPKEYKWSSYNFHFNGNTPLKKYIKVDTDLIDNYFKKTKKLDSAIFERKIKNVEIDEYKHKQFDRLSNSELFGIISSLTSGKSIFNLTKSELEDLIIKLNAETNASMFQIASLTHENYDYVRKICKTAEPLRANN
ncbi:MAG: transposase [Bacteroidales bacterium]|nr:transposase [Bacteroidales bacterium]